MPSKCIRITILIAFRRNRTSRNRSNITIGGKTKQTNRQSGTMVWQSTRLKIIAPNGVRFGAMWWITSQVDIRGFWHTTHWFRNKTTGSAICGIGPSAEFCLACIVVLVACCVDIRVQAVAVISNQLAAEWWCVLVDVDGFAATVVCARVKTLVHFLDCGGAERSRNVFLVGFF